MNGLIAAAAPGTRWQHSREAGKPPAGRDGLPFFAQHGIRGGEAVWWLRPVAAARRAAPPPRHLST
jgi:hypothetical protein